MKSHCCSILARGIAVAAVTLFAGEALAHGGFESETEVRVEAERMRVVVRTSLPFAWRMLGDRAPAVADDATKAAAKPLLAEAAKELFEVTAGGTPMPPVKADCHFEVHDLHDHAAFVIDHARPAAWPVTVKARFFEKIGELDEGTITVLDHTASRFQRDVEPLLRKSLSRQSPAVTFDLGSTSATGAPAPASPTAAAPVSTPTPAAPPTRTWLVSLGLAAALLLAGLIRAAWRRARRVA